jgi:hypothetical protein
MMTMTKTFCEFMKTFILSDKIKPLESGVNDTLFCQRSPGGGYQ